MVTVNSLLGKLQKVNIEDVIYKALQETEDEYVKLQRQQMLLGQNSLGKIIGRYRNPAYKALKLRQNPQARGYVDLFKTGDFSRGIFARVDDTGLVVGSMDEKTNILQDKYGEEIFTLNRISKAEYLRTYLSPVTIKFLIEKLK